MKTYEYVIAVASGQKLSEVLNALGRGGFRLRALLPEDDRSDDEYAIIAEREHVCDCWKHEKQVCDICQHVDPSNPAKDA